MKKLFFGIITPIIFILLLQTILVYSLGGTNSATFEGFLKFVDRAPEVSIPFLDWNASFEILGDWGLFNVFRDILNGILSIVNVLRDTINVTIYLTNAVIKVITYVIYFVGYIFYVPFSA